MSAAKRARSKTGSKVAVSYAARIAKLVGDGEARFETAWKLSRALREPLEDSEKTANQVKYEEAICAGFEVCKQMAMEASRFQLGTLERTEWTHGMMTMLSTFFCRFGVNLTVCAILRCALPLPTPCGSFVRKPWFILVFFFLVNRVISHNLAFSPNLRARSPLYRTLSPRILFQTPVFSQFNVIPPRNLAFFPSPRNHSPPNLLVLQNRHFPKDITDLEGKGAAYDDAASRNTIVCDFEAYFGKHLQDGHSWPYYGSDYGRGQLDCEQGRQVTEISLKVFCVRTFGLRTDFLADNGFADVIKQPGLVAKIFEFENGDYASIMFCLRNGHWSGEKLVLMRNATDAQLSKLVQEMWDPTTDRPQPRSDPPTIATASAAKHGLAITALVRKQRVEEFVPRGGAAKSFRRYPRTGRRAEEMALKNKNRNNRFRCNISGTQCPDKSAPVRNSAMADARAMGRLGGNAAHRKGLARLAATGIYQKTQEEHDAAVERGREQYRASLEQLEVFAMCEEDVREVLNAARLDGTHPASAIEDGSESIYGYELDVECAAAKMQCDNEIVFVIAVESAKEFMAFACKDVEVFLHGSYWFGLTERNLRDQFEMALCEPRWKLCWKQFTFSVLVGPHLGMGDFKAISSISSSTGNHIEIEVGGKPEMSSAEGGGGGGGGAAAGAGAGAGAAALVVAAASDATPKSSKASAAEIADARSRDLAALQFLNGYC